MKKRIILLTAVVCLVLSGCSGKKTEADDISEEHTEEYPDLSMSEPVSTGFEEMESLVVSTEDSYVVLKRAGASQSLFLEEDISSLIEQARINPAPVTATAVPENAPDEEPSDTEAEETGEEETEESAEETEETNEAEETPEETPEETAPQPATGGGRIVCIDAGHQSKQNSGKEPIGPGATETKMKVTSGTRGSATGVSEYQLTMDVALKLQNVLQQRGYTVVMCRSSNDVNISNAERATTANNAGAGAFIRIHADGSESPSAAGASTLAPSASNPYCASISSSSQSLAKTVLNSYCAKTGMKNRGVQITDNMTGLNWSQVPVTIIEMGFMTNPSEDQLMQTESFKQSAAEGIADGIDAYFGR